MIRASDLLGSEVRTESGDRLGRVHDLRAHQDGGGWVLIGLVVGRGGLRARLGVGGDEPVREGNVVPWEAVVALDDGRITVRDVIAAAPTP
jgi:sporulation protein YlmC with PRC-barrel domain